jgi:hypothetical protein
VFVSDLMAAFLGGLVAGGPPPAAPVQNPMSPASSDSSSATPVSAPASLAVDPRSPAQSDVQALASDPTNASAASASAAAASYGLSAPSGSSTASLGVVVAAYVSNMEPTSADAASVDPPATHATLSASAAPVSHPGSRGENRDHASAPVVVSNAAAA